MRHRFQYGSVTQVFSHFCNPIFKGLFYIEQDSAEKINTIRLSSPKLKVLLFRPQASASLSLLTQLYCGDERNIKKPHVKYAAYYYPMWALVTLPLSISRLTLSVL